VKGKALPFRTWNILDQKKNVIMLQWVIIVVLSFATVMMWIGWARTPKQLQVYIPPDLSKGITQKANAIPLPYVYSFAMQLWQEINYWPQSGDSDYDKNLNQWRSYLSPSFFQLLREEQQHKLQSGELARVRILQGMQGESYSIEKVKQLGTNTWEVDMDMRLTETKEGVVTKDVEILYPLRIVRLPVSLHQNPYGLAIDGFVRAPKRIKTMI
tara:strand:+ start:5054 stop:5692 length:639 start_codon:yes stop_codon:yes gene_type:complete